jgi:hypothetical protein
MPGNPTLRRPSTGVRPMRLPLRERLGLRAVKWGVFSPPTPPQAPDRMALPPRATPSLTLYLPRAAHQRSPPACATPGLWMACTATSAHHSRWGTSQGLVVGVAVPVPVGVHVAEAVGLGDAVAVAVAVWVLEAVGLGLAVAEAVAVPVPLALGLGVAVLVSVEDGVARGVPEAVWVSVDVGVARHGRASAGRCRAGRRGGWGHGRGGAPHHRGATGLQSSCRAAQAPQRTPA